MNESKSLTAGELGETQNGLLPCPFCGSSITFIEPDEWGSGGQRVPPIHVGCVTCKAEQRGDYEEDARANWNKRASLQSLRDYQRQLYEECLAAGWDSTQRNSFAEECAHLHEEVSEAFRAFRAHRTFDTWIDNTGKPQGIPVELADVLIGLFYNAELHGFDLWEAVEQKRAYNRTRNYVAEARQLHAPNVADERTAPARKD